MATKKQAVRQISSFDELDASGIGAGYTPYSSPEVAQVAPEATPEPRGTMRAIGDVGLAFGQGAIGGFKAISDLAGTNNPVSSTMQGMTDYLQSAKSDQSQATMQASQARVKQAEGTGELWEEVKAYGDMIWDQPGEMLAQAAGSFSTLHVGKLAQAAKLANAAKASGLSKAAFLQSPTGKLAIEEAAKTGFRTNVAVGAGQGVGAAKGSQYEQTYQAALERGIPEEQAKALADEAQSYGGAGTMQQVLGGGLGLLATATGPIEKMVAGVNKGGQGVMRSAVQGGATEFATEGAQGAQERYAGNDAAIDSGVMNEAQRYRGVAGQGFMEGTLGGILGGGAGALTGGGATQPVADAPPAAPTLQIGNTPDPLISFPDGTVARRSEIDGYINALPPDKQPAMRAKLMGLAPQPADAVRATKVPEGGPMTAAVNAGIEAKALEVETQQSADLQDLADLVATESRNKQVMLAQMDMERQKQAEIDAAFEAKPALDAQQRAAELDAPNVMAQAFQRAQTPAEQPATVEQAPVAPIESVAPEPRIVERTPDMPAPMPRELAELQVDMDGGEVVRTQNRNGKWAYHVVKPAPPAAPPPATDIMNKLGKPFTNLFAAKTEAGRRGAGFEPVKVGESAYVVRQVSQPINQGASDGNQNAQTSQTPEALLTGADPQPQPTESTLEPQAPIAQQTAQERPKAPKPDLTPDQQVELGGVLARDFEKQYQQDLVTELKRKRGLLPAEKDGELKRSPFKTFLIRHGVSDKPADVVGEGNAFRANNIIPTLFRKNGIGMDELVNRAAEAGFITQEEADNGEGVPKLVEMIRSEVAGTKRHLPLDMQDESAEQRADYFTSGNIVQGYSGHDRVISYKASDDKGEGWNVTVQSVVKQDGQWVIDPKDKRVRTHSTSPEKADLARGPIEAKAPAEISQKPADVPLIKPPADGKPLPNATARGEVEPSADEVKRFYVTMIRGSQVARLAGPFDTKEHAESMVDRAREEANKADPRSAFDAFGVSGVTEQEPKPGVLNVQLGIGKDAVPATEKAAYTPADADAARKQALTQIEAAIDGMKGEAVQKRAAVFLPSMGMKTPIGKARIKTALADPKVNMLAAASEFGVRLPISLADMLEAQIEGRLVVAEKKPAEQPAAQEPAKPVDKIEDVGEKIGGARKDTASSTGRRAPAAKEEADTRATWEKRFSIGQVARGFDISVNGRDITGKWSITDTREKDSFGGGRALGGYFDTEAEAKAALPLIAVAQKHSVATAREYDAAGNLPYEIWRKISDNKRVKVVDKQFPTRNEAMEYMAKHAREILETSTTFGEADLPKPESTVRTGVARRTGDVEGKDFQDAFGFRGVEFGNWNNQTERQEVMNAAYDGLMDLADVLGVPPKAIGLNGDLALAFGARGQGLSSARAHYERNRVVMNLTKMNGAGALAHEWFHALDHYLGRQDGKASSTWKINPDGTRSLDTKGAEADMASSGFRVNNSGVREELRAAYKTLIQTLFYKAEQYVEDTAKADKFVGVARSDLAKELDKLRKDLASERTWGKRNNSPASAEQLAEFDAVAAALVEGRGLETEWKYTSANTFIKARGAMIGRHTNESLEKISDIYKAVRGRSGFNSEKTGVADSLRSYITRYHQRLKMLATANSAETKTKNVPTNFAMDAKSLDQGHGGDYWTSPHEMAARAFQGYVEDMISAKDGKSPFLNYAPENVGILTPWGAKRPYPSGEERKALNKAFDAFVNTIQTKETDKGVAMFSSKLFVPASMRSVVKASPQTIQQFADGIAKVAKTAFSDQCSGEPRCCHQCRGRQPCEHSRG